MNFRQQLNKTKPNLSLGVDLRNNHNRVSIDRLLVTQSGVLLKPDVLVPHGFPHLLHLGRFNVIIFLILQHSTDGPK